MSSSAGEILREVEALLEGAGAKAAAEPAIREMIAAVFMVVICLIDGERARKAISRQSSNLFFSISLGLKMMLSGEFFLTRGNVPVKKYVEWQSYVTKDTFNCETPILMKITIKITMMKLHHPK
jgi:hypothetical protein